MNDRDNQLVKIDAYEKAQGKTKYTFDLYLPKMVYGKVLRSSKAHARVKEIRVRKAEALPGVKCVITSNDVPRNPFNPIFNAPDPHDHTFLKDDLILESVSRYIGTPIAAVAAEDEFTAEKALQLIEVDYEDFPAIFEPKEALNSKPIRSDRRNNIATTNGEPIVFRIGDAKGELSKSERIFEGTYETQRVHQLPLETLVTMCDLDSSGRLIVWSATQSIHGLRANLAQALDIPVSKIVVNKPVLGGAFGAKLDMKDIDPICALLCLKTKRPVRIESTREEFMSITPRHPAVITLKTAFNSENKITSMYCKAIFDIGANADHGPIVTTVCGLTFLGAYKTPNLLFEGYPVYTNNPPSGAMRGYGGPQVNFAIECHMDEIAESLGVDPIALKLSNAFERGDISPMTGFIIESCGLRECAEYGSKVVEWKNRTRGIKEKASVKNGHNNLRQGLGVAFSNQFASGVYGAESTQVEYSGAIVKFNEDGTVNLITAIVDQGGGQSTVLAQIVAEQIGIKPQDVRVSSTDTENSLFDVATHASRVTYVAGYAAKVAATEARQQLLTIAAEIMTCDPGDLRIQEGRIMNKNGDQQKSLPLVDVLWYAHYRKQTTIIGKSSTAPPGNPPAFGVLFAEVEVNIDTGKVRVTRMIDAHDVGRVVNTLGAEGQFEGAVAQGLGFALYEELLMKDGQVLNSNLGDYKVATCYEIPEDVSIKFINMNEPSGVGAKGLGESVILHIAPAIANAIHDAIGIRFRKLPITPEEILKSIAAESLTLSKGTIPN
jgi:xanthine dehydrogenase molybdenum-binding subunit